MTPSQRVPALQLLSISGERYDLARWQPRSSLLASQLRAVPGKVIERCLMAVKSVPRRRPARGKPPLLVVTFVALVVALVVVSTWAKTSRYDRYASPSRHFSTSVKVVRGHSDAYAGTQLHADVTPLPGRPAAPSRVLAPVPEPLLAQAVPSVLPFPPLRAPPSAS